MAHGTVNILYVVYISLYTPGTEQKATRISSDVLVPHSSMGPIDSCIPAMSLMYAAAPLFPSLGVCVGGMRMDSMSRRHLYNATHALYRRTCSAWCARCWGVAVCAMEFSIGWKRCSICLNWSAAIIDGEMCCKILDLQYLYVCLREVGALDGLRGLGVDERDVTVR